MRQALAQQRVPDIGQLIFLQSFERFEGEPSLAMRRPRALQLAIAVIALAEREPDAVLDGVEIERTAYPGLARRRTTHGEDPGDALALLVGRDRSLSVLGFHGKFP